MAASVDYSWSRGELVLWSLSRILLVPLLVSCAAPRYSPLIQGDFWPILISAILGLTNGVFGSVPMILGPKSISERDKELAGNIMTLSYSVGLTSGSAAAYWLDTFLGNSTTRPCHRGNTRAAWGARFTQPFLTSSYHASWPDLAKTLSPNSSSTIETIVNTVPDMSAMSSNTTASATATTLLAIMYETLSSVIQTSTIPSTTVFSNQTIL